jgi:nucleoside-diphosphate-sugar epimerase
MAATTKSRSLLVCGGSGFLGSRICKIASARNWAVTSLSRHGEPAWPQQQRPEWASKVNWRKGDVMDPSTYREALKDVDAVVHSLGILLEADYKGVLTGKEPIVSGLKKAFDSTRHTDENTVKAGHAAFTYETMNRDTGSFPTVRERAAQADVCLFCSGYAGRRSGEGQS